MQQPSPTAADVPLVRPATLHLPGSPVTATKSSPSLHASPGPQSPTAVPLTYQEAELLLTRGEDFIKYQCTSKLLAVFGRPSTEAKYVFYEPGQSGAMGSLFWCTPGLRVKNMPRCIPLAHVTALLEQTETPSFGKQLSVAERACCFSIVCGPWRNTRGELIQGRTLDLQASSVATRCLWMHAIHQLLSRAGFDVLEAKDATPLGTISPSQAKQGAILAAANGLAPPEPSPSELSAPIPILSPTSIESPPSQLPQPEASPGHGHAQVAPDLVGVARLIELPQSPLAVEAPSPVPSPEPGSTVDGDAVITVSPPSKHSPGHSKLAISATMTVPSYADEVAMRQLLSPSEHPTATPACSPLCSPLCA